MDVNDPAALQRRASHVSWWSLGTLFLTTVHHVYGGLVYRTAWRLHVAPVSTIAAVAIVGARRVLRKPHDDGAGKIAFWTLATVTFLTVAGIGLFEGGYNHALKDGLYFGGASPRLMRHLFPSPTYEMPDDAFFEFTGVLQVVLGSTAGWYLYRLLQLRSSASTTWSRA